MLMDCTDFVNITEDASKKQSFTELWKLWDGSHVQSLLFMSSIKDTLAPLLLGCPKRTKNALFILSSDGIEFC